MKQRKKNVKQTRQESYDDLPMMTEEEANELVFGEFAEELEIYGLTDIGNK
jgi:hypothetical protein